MSLRERVVSFRIRKRGGLIAHESDPALVGQSFGETDNLARAFAGEVIADLEDLSDAQDAGEWARGIPVLEIESPIREAHTTHYRGYRILRRGGRAGGRTCRGDDIVDVGDGKDGVGGGDDIIDGGPGSSRYLGGLGSATTIFAANGAWEKIHDFEDSIDLIDFAAYGFADANETLSFVYELLGSTNFDFGHGDVLEVSKVALTDIDAAGLIVRGTPLPVTRGSAARAMPGSQQVTRPPGLTAHRRHRDHNLC